MRVPIIVTRSEDKIVVNDWRGIHVAVLTIEEAQNLQEHLKTALEINPRFNPSFPDESHPCTFPGCKNSVPYDDEPRCYNHSPDKGSNIQGYSYKAQACPSCWGGTGVVCASCQQTTP